MISRTHINRLLILVFMVLVGYSLAYGIKVQSIIGIILSLVSLGAGIYFLYLLAKAQEQLKQEQDEGI
jgi:disulfide bond formation protein DsbB